MLVRNTVSGVVVDLPAEKALGHAHFGRFYKPVTNTKNEVLTPPHEVDENGERKSLEVKATAPKKAEDK